MEKIKNKTVALFLNGDFCRADFEGSFKVEDFSLIIACDGGFRHANSLGIKCNLVIGDFDSLGDRPFGVSAVKYPSEKDFTDGELGFMYAVDAGCTDIFVFGGLGGRFSHTIANLAVATRFASGRNITFVGMGEKVMPKTESFVLKEKVGSTISLAPIFEDVNIISTKGLKYPMENSLLKVNSSRGISNVAIEELQSVEFESGVLLVSVWEGKE